MKIVIPDDYQDAVRALDCYGKAAGHEVTVHRDTVSETDALAARFRDADAIVLIRQRTKIEAALVERLPKLRLIVQTGAVGNHIDLAACTRKGVAVIAGSGSPHSTAELTWALILASVRHVALEDRRLRAGQWQTTLGTGLRGRTLGVFGYGKIGSLVARVGAAFGMRILVFGRTNSIQSAARDGFDAAATKAELFSASDVLTTHLRMIPETRGIITRADLARMKPAAHFINSSRAELLEPGALVDALRAGRPGFAAVDVYEDEPVLGARHPLLSMDNVVCTPHLGYVEKDNYERYFGRAFDSINEFATGGTAGVINPEALAAR